MMNVLADEYENLAESSCGGIYLVNKGVKKTRA